MRPTRPAAIAAIAVIAVSAALAWGCGSSTASPSPSPAPAAMPSAVLATLSAAPAGSVECTPDAGLAEVRRLLAGSDFEAHYLTIDSKLTISFWVVDPDVDPAAAQTDVPANFDQAYDFGLGLSYRVAKLPCASRHFVQVNPMIVDRADQNWYIGFIPADALAGAAGPAAADLRKAMTEAGIEPARKRDHAPVDPASVSPNPTGSCNWSAARVAAKSRLSTGAPNVAAYEIIGGGLPRPDPFNTAAPVDVDVEVQWVVGSGEVPPDDAIVARLRDVLAPMVCLSPAVDDVQVYVVDPVGRLIVYAQVGGLALRSGDLSPASVSIAR